MSTDKLNQMLLEGKSVVIYGAGVMGRALKKCLEDMPYHCKVDAFLVGKREHNPNSIDGIRVLTISEGSFLKNRCVLVALHEKNIEDALNLLIQNGFLNLHSISFDSDEWEMIRANWLSVHTEMRHFKIDKPKELIGEKNDGRVKLKVYVATGVFDKSNNATEKMAPFEKKIQVGAALTEERISDNIDCDGDNISDKNPQFCELTALYWIWKNDTSDYVGLSHYRRRFLLSKDFLKAIDSGKIDFILTIPIINFETIKIQYEKDHVAEHWKILKGIVHKMYSDYDQDFEMVENGYIYYGYNMFIANRKAFNEYCEWLFSILFACEETIGKLGDKYQNRYIGFLAERLLIVFLSHNRNKYTMLESAKHFIDMS